MSVCIYQRRCADIEEQLYEIVRGKHFALNSYS